MYTGQTMKLPSYNLKLDEVIFNFAYDNAKKAKDYQMKVLEDGYEKDEDNEKIKAKISKETKKIVHDQVIQEDR